ncbi:MAG TPA: glycogen synthase GlgA [Clostridia bacterium]|nr:glycogen synthase GlgA [Clostridia bacterium]
MKILYVASEAGPFIRSGGLGDVAASLPKAIKSQGHDIRVIIPYYKEEIAQSYKQTMAFVGSTFVELGWRRQYCGVYEANFEGITYYFIDNEYYFKRKGLYGHFDDGERFAFFSRAVLEVLPVIDFYPDIIHANDWQTALVPAFLDIFYRFSEEFQNIKTVFTIHNIEFQGKYDKCIIGDILGVPAWAYSIIESDNCANFMKAGIESSNIVTTVSETYAEEILNPFYSYGLHGILSERKSKIRGVINGIDTKHYSPKSDKALFANYTLKTIAKKLENKKGLCEMVNLPYKADRPVLAMVTRLTEQKGMDLIMTVIEQILSADLQLVILGKGDWKYEQALAHIEENYASKFRAIINFSPDIASKLYAGSDMFLMPSKFEPCGLSQMISMSYGSVPIVRETGGLKDSVLPFNSVTGEGTGFTFLTYNAYDMLDAVWRAFGTFKDKANWGKVMANCMNADFSWAKSAKKYVDIYESI